MKKKTDIFGIFILLVIMIINCTQQSDFPILKGPHLGQKPPGMIPEIFLPNILNTEEMRAFGSVFSPDGDEFYFVYIEKSVDLSGGIARMRKVNNIWTRPEFPHFNSETWDNDMCLSTDGNLLIFRSFRALPDGNKSKDQAYLWFVERTENGWSSAKPLYCGNEPVSTVYPSITENAILYFAHKRNGIGGIYRTKPVNGIYGTPEHVFSAVDSIDTERDMFIAPDESYMIISCINHPDNTGGRRWGDLYVTFQRNDGTWIEEINMGNLINTGVVEYCPQVTPDGKYFFFTRYNPEAKRGNIYWMDAKIIENLKPNYLK